MEMKIDDQNEVFDPVIVGPWMDLWNLTTHELSKPNKHLDRYLASSPEARSIAPYQDTGNW